RKTPDGRCEPETRVPAGRYQRPSTGRQNLRRHRDALRVLKERVRVQDQRPGREGSFVGHQEHRLRGGGRVPRLKTSCCREAGNVYLGRRKIRRTFGESSVGGWEL
ncbi:uncharacterized protein METZ01_LOCUS423499, partial [marine metagenome]